MKSNRAKEHLQEHTSSRYFAGIEFLDIPLEEAREAVKIAEQDAKEGFLEIFKKFITEWKDTPIQDWMVTEFMEILNNGGQSNE